MRHLTTITTLLFLLGLLGASGASAGAAVSIITMAAASSNSIKAAEKQKEIDSNRISCLPQGDSQQQLWRCTDAYGNQYDNLVIVLQSEIDRLKNGNTNSKRAGK